MKKILFVVFAFIIIFGCELENKSITDVQKDYTFNITKPEFLIGSRPGNLIEFEGYLYSINGDSEYIQLDWVSNIDGVFRETQTNSSGKVHFYYGELSNNVHQISIVLSDPDIEQSDTLNYLTIYNNMPESIDLNMHRFIGKFSENWYFIGDSELIWDRADSLALVNNMHLVTITSESENTFIKHSLSSEYYYEYENYWIGLFFNTETSVVDWVTDEPVEYTGYSNQSLMPDIEKRFSFV
ncbi:MAG: C-type lectin domain-containing protein, partial [Candidatus Delongbacteria bacterium]|nr:C-type lectin domain-containing protein [Candidatus Delongbacteria bacterium]